MFNTSKEYVDFLYNSLPSVYRTEDRGDLYEYLKVLSCGYKTLFDDTYNIHKLLDINNCPEKFLPYLCRNFGVVYTPDIPSIYYRRILQNIVELYKRKGTISSLNFLARDLSGFDVDVVRDEHVYNLYLANLHSSIDNIQDTEIAQGVIERYLDYFAPIGTDVNVVLYFSLEYGRVFSVNQFLFNNVEVTIRNDVPSFSLLEFNTVIGKRLTSKIPEADVYLNTGINKSIHMGSKEASHFGILKESKGVKYNGFQKFDGSYKYNSFDDEEITEI